MLGLAHAAHAGQWLSTRRTAKAAQGTRWLTLSRLAFDIGQRGLALAIRTAPKKDIPSPDTAQGLAARRTGMSGCNISIRHWVAFETRLAFDNDESSNEKSEELSVSKTFRCLILGDKYFF